MHTEPKVAEALGDDITCYNNLSGMIVLEYPCVYPGMVVAKLYIYIY